MARELGYRQYLPVTALRPWVHSLYEIQGPCREVAPQHILPDGCMSLVLNFSAPLDRLQTNGVLLRLPQTFVIGEVRRPFALQSTGSVDVIGVRFWPGALRHFIDGPTGALVDGLSDESALHRTLARRIADTVHGCEPAHRSRLLQQVLAEHARQRRPTGDDLLDAAVRALWQREGCVPIEAWAASFGVTRRSLERRFADGLGVPPKALADVLRFRRVLRTLAAEAVHGPPDLPRIAVDCGYYDQSHMIRHFKRFSGAAPSILKQTYDQSYLTMLRREAAAF